MRKQFPQRLAPEHIEKTLEEAEMLPLRFFLLGKPEYTEDAKIPWKQRFSPVFTSAKALTEATQF